MNTATTTTSAVDQLIEALKKAAHNTDGVIVKITAEDIGELVSSNPRMVSILEQHTDAVEQVAHHIVDAISWLELEHQVDVHAVQASIVATQPPSDEVIAEALALASGMEAPDEAFAGFAPGD